MPKGTAVESCYQKVKKQGHSEGSAARICQSATGEALATGKPPKRHKCLAPKIKCSNLRKNKHLCKCDHCRG